MSPDYPPTPPELPERLEQARQLFSDYPDEDFDAPDRPAVDLTSFDPRTATDEQIGAYLRAGGDIMAIVDAGRAKLIGPGDPDRVTRIRRHEDPDDLPMHVKSLRIPLGLYEAAEALNHPKGFSGVVRDALTAHLAAAAPPVDDVMHAVAVLQHAAERLAAAERHAA